jgi:PAS domain S-box-containing protein
MHFVGMLALFLPMTVTYDSGLTLLSLVVAIGVTGFGFFTIGARRVTGPEFVLSGIFMGIGIVSMHYTGMAAMRMPADIRYDSVLVALSVLIAIGASIAALWLAFRTTVIWQRLLAAAVMGSAISGMHYTGMAAATFIATPGMDGARDVPVLAQMDLALAIATITFVILLLALVASAFDRKLTKLAERETALLRENEQLQFNQFVTGILAKSEARFRATFENAAVGIAHVAPGGRWLRVNEALCRILGYPADELITKSFQDITHPDDLAADLAEVKGILDGKIDSYRMDKRCLRKDGSVVWTRLTVSAVRKSGGAVDYLVKVIEDISARKQAEQALQASKDCLQFALDATQLGWWQYDPLRRVISGDTRAQKLFNAPAGDISIEDIVTKRLHSDDAQRVWEAFQAALEPANPRPYATQYQVKRGAGDVRWVEAHGLAHFEGSGRERRAVSIVGTVQDITERKEREEKEHLLMREINHRAKNMLSVVESIAHQTAAQNPEDFVERFSERIQALSANQDLLVRNEWQGVDVEDLVRAQLAHFADLIGSRIVLQGAKLRLNPASTQAIGLALHELATNAGKYGALSTDRGRVDISWATTDDTLTMSWTERHGPPVSVPHQRGFGSIVMEAMMERSVGGKVRLDYAPSGIAWRLACPAGNALAWAPKARDIQTH